MRLDKKVYHISDASSWAGRKEGEELLYMHQIIQRIDLNTYNFNNDPNRSAAIVGYCCDEGVRRNQGRVGAVNGPENIRKLLGRLSIPMVKVSSILDVGDVNCAENDMESTQGMLSEIVCQLLENARFPIVLGGGHDMAFGHYMGIKKFWENNSSEGKIGIVNLDAHFDLRSPENDPHSGTPFYQIAEECQSSSMTFNYLCIGIQPSSNSDILFQAAEKYDVDYLEIEECSILNLRDIRERVANFLKKVDYIYLTIDMDAFSSALAPGVSAPNPFGLSPEFAKEVIRQITQSDKLISMDVAELNPTYDRDHSTARLAAGLIHYTLARLNE